MFTRTVAVLAVALALAGCDLVAGGQASPTPLAEHVVEPQDVPETAIATIEPSATATEVAAARTLYDEYGSAYDELYAAMEPSDALIDAWNSARLDEDWVAVREVSGRLADALRELQTAVLAMDWPSDAAEPAQKFAAALDAEISWYAYVSVARDVPETIEALERPWSDDAVSAAGALWTVLEAGLGLE